jgi:exonuclease III
MSGIATYPTILTLTVNRLNSSIKRQDLAHWIKKEDLAICCLQETHLIGRNKHWVRVKGWNKIYQDNGLQTQEGITVLASAKVDFKLTVGN